MPFLRPLILIENLIKKGIITEKVIVQSGHSHFNTNLMELVPFFSPADLESLYQEAQ